MAELEYRSMSLVRECGIAVPDIELITSVKKNTFF